MGPPPSRSSNIPWRLVIGIGFVAIFAIGGAIASRGTTTASALDVGDCFENPGFGDFSSVEDQDCDAPHEIQIYGRVQNPAPSVLDPTGSDSAGLACEEMLFEIFASEHIQDPLIVIPEDFSLGLFSDTGPSRGDDVLCAIESASGGLVGSVLPDN